MSSKMKLIGWLRPLAAMVGMVLIFQNCARTNDFQTTSSGAELASTNASGDSSSSSHFVSERNLNTAQTAQAWTTDGCNTTSYHQDPSDQTLFWGRRMKYSAAAGEDPNNECTWKSWGIALYRADFSARKLTFIDFALKPNAVMADGRTLTTAYDPTVALINGVKYVAFECHGVGFPGSVGACVGPVGSDNKVIASSTRVYVDGFSEKNNALVTSASVPKLTTTSSGQAYLSWTQVIMNKSTGSWMRLKSRSIAFSPSMAMIYSDSNNAVDSYNPMTNNGAADLFDVKEIVPGKFFFTGARGENGCLNPLSGGECYYLEMGVANGIASSSFDFYSQAIYSLPDNPIEYFRWAYDPVQKTWGLFGTIIAKQGTTTGRTLNGGVYFIPIADVNALPVRNVYACDPVNQPAPHWGMKNNQCLRSCGGLGGTRAYTTSCAANAGIDVGVSYDAPYCCTDGTAPVIPSQGNPSGACNPITQPSPHWGMKNGQCLQSCGGIGGTAAYTDSCSKHKMYEVGTAYDVSFCCSKTPPAAAPAAPAASCDPNSQPAPHWGMRDGQCLKSCGVLGGTAAYKTACSKHKMSDAGKAYDTPYCCK